MKPTNLFQDEAGNYSLSRVLPFVAFLFVLLLVAYATLRQGQLTPIPESWLTLLGLSFGTYAGSKALMLGTGKVNPVRVAEKAEATDGNA